MVAAGPVFILSPPRACTSLVGAMMGMHPELFILPELNLLVEDTLERFWKSGPKQGLLRAVGELYAGEQTLNSVIMARHWVTRRLGSSTIDVYRELIGRINPIVSVDNSPAYGYHPAYMQRILEAFPDARFLHVTRHPMAQCQSLLEFKSLKRGLLWADSVDYSGSNPVLDPQIAWHDTHINIMEFLGQIPRHRWMRIGVEQLLGDLDVELRALCEWLEIRSDQQAVDTMKKPEDSPFAGFGPALAPLGNDPDFLRNPGLGSCPLEDFTLLGPLPWREDGQGFHPSVIELAEEFGYQREITLGLVDEKY